MDMPTKNTRRRSRNISQGNKQQTSASANDPNPNEESELAPNLNGDAGVKTGLADQPKSDSEEPKAADEEIGKGKTKGKKRKAEDENANEKNDKKDTDDQATPKETETSKEEDKEESANVEEDTTSDRGKNIKTADSSSPAKEDKAESDKDECETMDTPQKGKKRKQPESMEEVESTPAPSKVEIEAEESDMDLLPKQHLGKGKRARIPNKKYSNVIIASKRNFKITKSVEKKESERESSDMSTREESLSPLMVVDQGDIEGPTKKIRPSTNIKDPKYLKPFECGWKRELVIRGSGSNEANLKRNCDVYYFTPAGKKVRSMREVIENLTQKELTVDNFTFFKEAVGINDPEKELIRAARRVSTPVMLHKLIEKPASKTPKASKSPNKNEASPQSSPKLPTIKAVDSPASEVKARRRNAGKFKIDLQTIKKEMKKPEKKQQDDVESLPVPSKATPAKKAKITKMKASATPKRSSKPTQKVPPTPKDKQEVKLQDNYCQNVCYTYNTMLYVFQFLKVQDLLRAGCVCKMWHDIANHRSLWQTVRMKNSQVHSFKGLANTLKKHGTHHLDLRKMLLPTGGDEIWLEFSEEIEKVDTLRKIELCRCPANVVEKLALTNPNLEVINAVTIKCEAMDLSPLAALKQIRELKLKSTSGLVLTSKLDALKDMKSLKHLSLTSIRELNKMNLDSITELTELESLELGECTDFPKRFGNEILIKLTKLEKLRLEKGQDECHIFDILEAVKNMPHLEQLELVNFDIKTGFDKALGSCQNIKQLLIIPRYITQSATTNHMVLEGVLKLRKSLSNFVWGVTLELLRVTELFLDQYDKKEAIEMKSSGNVDGIPILHPVSVDDGNTETSQNSLQMKILPLQSVQKLLMENLPTTRVKILKIPFHATWRQTIKDSVD